MTTTTAPDSIVAAISNPPTLAGRVSVRTTTGRNGDKLLILDEVPPPTNTLAAIHECASDDESAQQCMRCRRRLCASEHFDEDDAFCKQCRAKELLVSPNPEPGWMRARRESELAFLWTGK